MHALIVDDAVARLDQTMIAMMQAGFRTTGTGSATVAEACLRSNKVDLLVASDGAAGGMARRLVLVAQGRNPALGAILLTDVTGEEADRLFDALPALHCILARDSAASLITRLGLASAAASATVNGAPCAVRPAQMREATPYFATGRRPVGAVGAAVAACG